VNEQMKNPLGDLGISGKDMKIEEAMNVGQVLDQQARDEAIF
jgi:hypothetical protein